MAARVTIIDRMALLTVYIYLSVPFFSFTCVVFCWLKCRIKIINHLFLPHPLNGYLLSCACAVVHEWPLRHVNKQTGMFALKCKQSCGRICGRLIWLYIYMHNLLIFVRQLSLFLMYVGVLRPGLRRCTDTSDLRHFGPKTFRHYVFGAEVSRTVRH